MVPTLKILQRVESKNRVHFAVTDLMEKHVVSEFLGNSFWEVAIHQNRPERGEITSTSTVLVKPKYGA